MSDLVIIEKELSYLIMQAAFEVYNELGSGFPESIYDTAMSRELTRQGIGLERQKEIDVYFKGEKIGQFVLDSIANERVILEYKAVSEIAGIHKQQAVSYLKATGLELAIVINFGAERRMPHPDRGHAVERTGDIEIHLVARIETAEIDFAAVDHEPPRLPRRAQLRKGVLDRAAARRQRFDLQMAAHVPHQQ